MAMILPTIILSLMSTTIAILFDNLACPASQCVCENGVISCSRRRCSDFPDFNATTVRFHTLDYGYNQVNHIPASAFSSLEITHLYLNDNNISSIHFAAFNGLYISLLVLNLRNNRIKSLPPAIARLQSITEVDVAGNPLDGYRTDAKTNRHRDDFTDVVVRAIGDTVRKFSFGDVNFLTHWPRSIKHLQMMDELSIIGSRIQILPPDAFNSTTALKRLTIITANFLQIPIAIQALRNLQELNFNDNMIGNGNDVLIQPPFIGIARSLTILSLNNDRLNHFPQVVKHLTRLRNLTLSNNNIRLITDEDIDELKGTNVSVLSFRNCGLIRIPGTLSKLKALTEVDFSVNEIRTVEGHDLQYLRLLRKLVLADNPILYIASSSFYRLDRVSVLDLSNTSLSTLPDAIVNLYSLNLLYVKHTPIECTCELYWLKRWLVIYRRHLTIYGQCENIDQSVIKYVNERIPTCPDYTENLE